MFDFSSIFVPFDSDVIVRIFLSLILGFIIGLEREITNKAAGLRTNILVSVGSCVFTMLSIYGFSNALSIYPMGDPARVAAQILTGIGFIGGGCVLRHGTSIFGLTTAATLWATASVGMACGCGKFRLAILAAILSVATLTLIRIFERNCIPKTQKNNKNVKVSLICADEDFPSLITDIPKLFPNISSMTKKDAGYEKNCIKISFETLVCCKNTVEFVFEKFTGDLRVKDMSVKELSD